MIYPLRKENLRPEKLTEGAGDEKNLDVTSLFADAGGVGFPAPGFRQ
jgi:hypothetical protein